METAALREVDPSIWGEIKPLEIESRLLRDDALPTPRFLRFLALFLDVAKLTDFTEHDLPRAYEITILTRDNAGYRTNPSQNRAFTARTRYCLTVRLADFSIVPVK